jgi:hypothetical protein
MRERLLRAGVLLAASAILLYHVGWRSDSLGAHRESAAAPRPERDDCISVSSYHAAVASAVRNTDWDRTPRSADLPSGTRALIGEFVLLKELQSSERPPCPDLVPLLDGVRASLWPQLPSSDSPPTRADRAAAAVRPDPAAAQRTQADARTQSDRRGTEIADARAARMPQAVVIRPAHIRRQPSKSGGVVAIAPQGAAYQVFATKNDWVQVGNGSPEGWIAGFLLNR